MMLWKSNCWPSLLLAGLMLSGFAHEATWAQRPGDREIHQVVHTTRTQQRFDWGIRACQELARLGPQAEHTIPALAEAVWLGDTLDVFLFDPVFTPETILHANKLAFHEAAAEAMAKISGRPEVAVPGLLRTLDGVIQAALADTDPDPYDFGGGFGLDVCRCDSFDCWDTARCNREWQRQLQRLRQTRQSFVVSLIKALAAYGTDAAEALDQLLEMAGKQEFDAHWRIAAIGALAEIASDSDQEVRWELEGIAEYDPNRAVREAALRALQRLQQRFSGGSTDN